MHEETEDGLVMEGVLLYLVQVVTLLGDVTLN